MGKCKTAACEAAKARRNIAIFAIAVVGVLAITLYAGFITVSPTGEGPIPTVPNPDVNQSILFRGYCNRPGGGTPPYGTVTFIDASGYSWGSGNVLTTSAGGYTTGVIPSGATYYQYWNGSSLYYPAVTTITVDPITGLTEPANYYASIPTMTVPLIALLTVTS